MTRLDIWLFVWVTLTVGIFSGVGGYLYGHHEAYLVAEKAVDAAWGDGFDACLFSKKLHEFVRQGSSL